MVKLLKKPMSNSEYSRNFGLLCPFCGSNNLEWGEIDIGSGSAGQEVYCRNKNCQAEWDDYYQLKGYDVTREPNAQEKEQ